MCNRIFRYITKKHLEELDKERITNFETTLFMDDPRISIAGVTKLKIGG